MAVVQTRITIRYFFIALLPILFQTTLLRLLLSLLHAFLGLLFFLHGSIQQLLGILLAHLQVLLLLFLLLLLLLLLVLFLLILLVLVLFVLLVVTLVLLILLLF